MKNFKVYQEITLRRVVRVQADNKAAAEQAANYDIQDVDHFFSVEGEGWAYFESRDVVEEDKQN